MLSVLKKIFKVSNKIRIGIINFIFWILVLVIFSGLFGSNTTESGSEILLIQPQGYLLETPRDADLVTLLNSADEGLPKDSLVRDLIESINLAAEDNGIESILLDLDSMYGGGFAAVQEIGAALEKFKESGKEIVAFASYMRQEHYYLASYANSITLDPLGEIYINGIGVYRNYWKETLERFNVDVQIFRAGEYKSYVEPYMSTSMSDGVKEQNRLWMDSIWTGYLETIEKNRPFDNNTLLNFTQNKLSLLKKYNGNSSELAVKEGFVDDIKTREEFFKTNKDLYHFSDYLNNKRSINSGNIAVVVLEGAITYSDDSPGYISAVQVLDILDRVAEDDGIEGLVVRINSGGGGAYASEVIRRKIAELKESIPVVISMGDVCASGGYWIATAGDLILADNSTITGSIGVFGIAFGLQDTLENHLGVYNDGVGTTPYSGDGDITRNLSSENVAMYQLSVEDYYRRFLSLVSDSRDIDISKLENIAGGRVWSGEQAIEFNLVDRAGGFAEAKEYFSEEFGIKKPEFVYMSKEMSMFDTIVNTAFGNVRMDLSFLSKFVENPIIEEINMFERIDDPKKIYALWY